MLVFGWYLPTPRVGISESHHVSLRGDTIQLRYGYQVTQEKGSEVLPFAASKYFPLEVQDLQICPTCSIHSQPFPNTLQLYLEEALQIEQR